MSCFFCEGHGRLCLKCVTAVADELEGCTNCGEKEYALCDACDGAGEAKEDGDG